MRNYRIILALFVIASITVLYACSKYSDTLIPLRRDFPEEKVVTASIQGKVVDADGNPVQGATVTSGTETAATDAYGVFSFNDIKMSSRFGFVRVTKSGYFAGSRSIIADAGSSNMISITLIERSQAGSFTASTGGNVVVAAGDTVAFDAASVVDASTNTEYTGTVHVYAAGLDPLSKGASGRMPGDLRGIDSSGRETLMKSFGMMVVELEGDGGQRLQIAAGKHATITMKIPEALRASAATSIPLWYFNDTTGRWIQQGTAYRKGDTYCGQTSHFTWWNYDAPTGAVIFKLRLVDKLDQPLSFMLVELTSPTMGARGGYTDANGYIAGLIPKGEQLKMSIISACGTLVGGANIGPALADQELGTMKIDVGLPTAVFSGTLVDCDDKPVDSGFVNIVVDGLHYTGTVLKGAFTVPVARCAAGTTSASVVAGNYKTAQQSEPQAVTVNTGRVDLGQLTACGNTYEQYVRVSVGGVDYLMHYPVDSIGMWVTVDTTYFQSLPVTGSLGNKIYFMVPFLNGTGDFQCSYFKLTTDIGRFTLRSIQCTVTKYGEENDYIIGSLSGDVYFNGAASYPMTGIFKVRRSI